MNDNYKIFRDMLLFGTGFFKEELVEDENGVRIIKIHVPYDEIMKNGMDIENVRLKE